jgi:hypothetical protein
MEVDRTCPETMNVTPLKAHALRVRAALLVKRSMTRIYVTAMVGLGAAAWAFVLALYGWKLSPAFFKPFSIVVGVILAAALAFEALLWRLPRVNGCAPRPPRTGSRLWSSSWNSSAATGRPSSDSSGARRSPDR